MVYEFKLPDIGEGLVEAEVVRWLVKVGDFVKEDQSLCEVLTEKAAIEVPSPVSGKVLELLAKEGQVVPVQTVIVRIDTEVSGEGGAPSAPREKDEEDMPLFSPTKPAKWSKPAEKAAAPKPSPDAAPASEPPAAPAGKADGVLAAPATRRLARELGVDLAEARGTGPGGRVTPEDVKAAAERATAAPVRSPSPAKKPAAPASGGDRREPFRGVRRKISERMVQAKRTAPHYSYMEEVDVTELVKLHAEARSVAEAKGVKLTYTPFFVKAAVEGLKRYPIVNSSLDDEAQEIVYKGSYNIGIAAATEQGLIVPVVKDCDHKGLFELSREIRRVTEAARAGKSALGDLRGGTFTITNVGSIGGLAATPILNVPEVGIMGVGAIRKRPWFFEGRVAIRDILVLSMTFDHRIVDGAVGARFTQEVKRYLENPGLLALV